MAAHIAKWVNGEDACKRGKPTFLRGDTIVRNDQYAVIGQWTYWPFMCMKQVIAKGDNIEIDKSTGGSHDVNGVRWVEGTCLYSVWSISWSPQPVSPHIHVMRHPQNQKIKSIQDNIHVLTDMKKVL